ncbi:flavin reductase family protein [Saccharopolyspora sp. ID03-671]|uniref:flavin reductase family protein n=1 Tax=Saccharopolyspora sp. ID03-671 TaxID=3073066 RepID=UPI00324A3BC2
MTAASAETQDLRGCLGRFATGVAVVTFDGFAGGEVKRHGLTINSFTSVSLDPPLVLIAVQRTVRAHALLAGRPFAVNVLAAEQRDLAMHFAGRPNTEPTWIEGRHAPRLAETASWFECTPWTEHDGGDHTLFLGKIERFDLRPGPCLGFADGTFFTIPEPT